jgi:methylaspartate ammonia-lyase
VAPALQGREITTFREIAEEVDGLLETVEIVRPLPEPAGMTRRDLLAAPARLWRAARREGETDVSTERITVERPLHTAVRYGVSQALLRAVAMTRGVTMAEVIAEEWELPLPELPVPIHAQSGGERYHNADKMIARRVASLPHALVDDIPEQLGEDGAKLTRYVRWLKGRIQELGDADYRPTIHLDVHGALGQIFENELGRVLGHLYALELAAQPYPLRIECPVMMESREAQIEAMTTLREYVRFRRMSVQLVVDEWANTLEDIRAFVDVQAADVIQIKMPDLGSVHSSVEAVLACQAGGTGAFLGGSCCETDLSAQVAVHIALATRPDMMMAKPGMGVDEGTMLVQNEMARILAWIRVRET